MKRPTIRDVARLAGVSLSTVSAVINGVDIVSEATKSNILTAVARLNYEPSVYASNLARRQTRILGLIVSSLINPFFSEIAEAFEKEALSHGYRMSLANTGFSSASLRSCVSQMLAMKVAGLAVLTSEFDDEAFAVLRSTKTPSVFLDVGTPGPHIGNIHVDTKTGMFLAVQHLVDLGHREILFVRNSRNSGTELSLLSHQYRNQGFMSAIRRYRSEGVTARVVDMPGSGAEAGYNSVASALKGKPFTAIVAITDMVALGVYRGLHEAGLRIPQDISIIGFDNTFISQFLSPPMSTVDIPKNDLSRLAVEMLLQHLQSGGNGREIELPTTLVSRQSTAALRIAPKGD